MVSMAQDYSDCFAAWHGRHVSIYSVVFLSIPGNQTLLRKYSFVLVRPWCPSCASAIMSCCNSLGITIRVPLITSDFTIDSSLKISLNG